MAKILDGVACAESVYSRLRPLIAELADNGSRPGLGTILVGDNPASAAYVRLKHAKCEELGITSVGVHLPNTASTQDIADQITKMNNDPNVSAFIVQMPLPEGINEPALLALVDPNKDADGLHPLNLGRLALGAETLLPCTPVGIIELLVANGIELRAKHVVIIGRGTTVGRPLAMMLSAKHDVTNAAVTVLHSAITDLGRYTRDADVIVSAAGVAGLVTKEMVKPGAVCVGAGFSRHGTRIMSDLSDDVNDVASWITPRLGGVGPMTVAMLCANTVAAALHVTGKDASQVFSKQIVGGFPA